MVKKLQFMINSKVKSLFSILVSLLLILILLHTSAKAQNEISDSLRHNRNKAVGFITPACLIATGVAFHYVPTLQPFNHFVRDAVQTNLFGRTKADNYVQYLPSVAMLGLDFVMKEHSSSFGERALSLSLGYLFMGAGVLCVKDNLRLLRPDSSAFNSFPSGHTATAFLGAELFRHYYRHLSPWYGVAAYTFAVATGFGRIFNNRHWFADVVCGAGVGILAARLAIMFSPYIRGFFAKRLSFFKKDNTSVFLSPMVEDNTAGISFSMRF